MWFPIEERLLSLTIGQLMAYLGMGCSFMVSPIIDIELNNLILSCATSFLAIIYIIFAREDPIVQEELSLKVYFKEFAKMLSNCTHSSLLLTVSGMAGLSYSLFGQIGSILKDEDLGSS